MDVVTLYTFIFYGSILLPLISFLFICLYPSTRNRKWTLQYFSIAYVLFLVSLIGFRPIGEDGFNDTSMYINWFQEAQNGLVLHNDIGFDLYTFILSKVGNVRFFFLFTSFFSIVLLIWNCFLIAKKEWFLLFMSFVVSIYFWHQNVFTIRQCLAAMLFLSAMIREKVFLKVFFIICSVFFHISFLLPAVCFLVVLVFRSTRFYIALWFIILLLVTLFGNSLYSYLQYFDVSHYPKLSYYFHGINLPEGIYTMIRWDVVLFSLLFIITGAFFMIKHPDQLPEKYKTIFNYFLFSNIFVILIMPVASGFIHRFAYLSWFVSPLIVFMPLVKLKNTYKIKDFVFAFVFFYFLILGYIGAKVYQNGGQLINENENLNLTLHEKTESNDGGWNPS